MKETAIALFFAIIKLQNHLVIVKYDQVLGAGLAWACTIKHFMTVIVAIL